MIQLLVHNPLLLLFLVAALGTLLGRLRVAGFSFGVAAVLFVGLASWWRAARPGRRGADERAALVVTGCPRTPLAFLTSGGRAAVPR